MLIPSEHLSLWQLARAGVYCPRQPLALWMWTIGGKWHIFFKHELIAVVPCHVVRVLFIGTVDLTIGKAAVLALVLSTSSRSKSFSKMFYSSTLGFSDPQGFYEFCSNASSWTWIQVFIQERDCLLLVLFSRSTCDENFRVLLIVLFCAEFIHVSMIHPPAAWVGFMVRWPSSR